MTQINMSQEMQLGARCQTAPARQTRSRAGGGEGGLRGMSPPGGRPGSSYANFFPPDIPPQGSKFDSLDARRWIPPHGEKFRKIQKIRRESNSSVVTRLTKGLPDRFRPYLQGGALPHGVAAAAAVVLHGRGAREDEAGGQIGQFGRIWAGGDPPQPPCGGVVGEPPPPGPPACLQ
eukprot:409103-Prorocentrum_minimum.AAC.1